MAGNVAHVVQASAMHKYKTWGRGLVFFKTHLEMNTRYRKSRQLPSTIAICYACFQNPLSTHTFSICLNHLSTGGMKSIKSNALEPDSPRCNQVPDAARCCQRLQDAGRSCQMLRDAAERSQMLPDTASPIAARCCQVLPEACSQNIHKHKYQYQCHYKCQSK